MSAAIKFLESNSIPSNNQLDDITEDVSLTDAIYATKMANLELANTLYELKTFTEVTAMLEDIIRQAKKDRVKV
jgi:hypothetical protein